MSELPHYQMYINGKWTDGGEASFQSMNPATEKPWASIAAASAADVDQAVRSAHDAFTQGPWPRMTATERGKWLRKLGEALAKHSEHLGRIETIDTGKLFKETRWQAAYIAEFYNFYAGLADKITGDTLPIDKPDMWAMTVREPLGVVAAVVPWNSQLFLSAVKIAPALAAGNTVVLKASEHASAPMLEFAKIVEEVDFPPGVINIVTGFGEPCGRELTAHPLVARISFTGGPDTARHVIRNSAENFAEVSLELGGKSPLVIFDDADIESAANGVLLSIFSASGQSCVAASRLLVHRDLKEELLARVVAKAEAIQIGDPLDDHSQMGPLATLGQMRNIENTLAGARSNGANIAHGGKRPTSLSSGWYFEPTIVECPDQSLDIVRNELFGPVVSVLEFETEAQAITLANDTRFGLASGVFSREVGRALRVSKAIRAGIVWVNTYRVVSPIAPFGGYKESGFGRESGLDAIHDYTRAKTVWINTSAEPIADPFVMQ
ncbi:MAG: aldehyde dehydrogenase [Pseudomonadota bacterium]